MAVTYHFDLYPRNDPRDGTRIVRFTKLQAAEYRAEANGTGVGRLSIRADEAEAQNIDPAGLQYVRVVRDDGSTELVVGGFWLENGDFEALTEKENRLLTFSGSGTIAYLQRAIMWSHVYYPGGEDPIGGAYYSIPGAGQTVGYILWRWVYQATLYRVGTTPYLHEHADGTVATDIHDDDRRENPLPYLTIGFDGDEDSDGNPWSIGFSSQRSLVGDSLLQAVRVLMQSGLYLEMDPDTFELRAWESATHRRDRSGGAWGANVVRFQAPTDGTTATGNIKSDATRGIAAFVKRSAVLAGSVDTYAVSSTGGSPIPWEGYVSGAPENTAALGELATAQIAARSDAGDVSRLRMKLGNDPSNGVYMPWEHVLLDDVVTVHTGTAQWDFNEDTFPVAALTVILRPAGDWDAYVDLGASFTSMVERAFQTAPIGNHSHPPNPLLCDRFSPGEDADVFLNWTWSEDDLSGFPQQTVQAYPSISQAEFTMSNGLNNGVNRWYRSTTAGSYLPHVGGTGGGDRYLSCTAGVPFSLAVDVGARNATPHTVTLRVHWYNNTPTQIGTGDTIYSASLGGAPSVHVTDTLTPPTGAVMWRIYIMGSVDNVVATTGTGTDAQNPYAGNSNRAARCDHTHPASEHAHDDYATASHSHPLEDLSDVDLSTPATDGQVLVYDDSTETWIPASAAGGGFSNPMTTAGDIIVGGASGTAARLAAGTDGHVLTLASGTPSWAAASGGGSGATWEQKVNQSGASFAAYTANTGTWASDGTIITQSDTAATVRRAYIATMYPVGYGAIAEAEIRFPTAGAGTGVNRRGGIYLHTSGAATSGLVVYLQESSGAVVADLESVATMGSIAYTVAKDTWYKLRGVYGNGVLSIYVDGTLIGSMRVLANNSHVGSYFSLFTFSTKVDFRNHKAWTLSGGAPA